MLTSRKIYNEVNYLILAINAALTSVENKIPNISNLVTKKKKNRLWHENYWNEKQVIDHGHDKYITTSAFNKLTT